MSRPTDPIEATVVLRRRAELPESAFLGPPLTRAELAERYGADPADLSSVTAAAASAGVEVISADPATRLVRLRGPAEALTSLGRAETVIGLLGLDPTPFARPLLRVARAADVTASYTPLQLATAYGFPDGDGSGQHLAIIELGGGFAAADLNAYFGGLGLTTPTVTAVGVDGAANEPGQDPTGADGEVLLDIEVAGAIAPAAQLLVYFAPNTDAGFVDAITQAAHADPAPTAMSISWGQSEDQWSAQSRQAMDAAIADAALLGVTVLAAAGDSGSADSEAAGAPHVDFPASSPHALGCGGTSLQLSSSGAVSSETVWNGGATGGGVSDAFPVPTWQASAGVPARAGGSSGRGVPDVAADADPQTGYRVRIDGSDTVIGGTSAVAPLLAGLVCRLAQAVGRPLGLLQPAIYAGAAADAAAPGFRDITEGDNGAYSAGPGWDPCTGLGVPIGTALLDVLRGASG
jgi:kumamolisin